MSLTKEDLHKLVTLKKFIGENFSDSEFQEWLKQQEQTNADPIATKLVRALKSLEMDRSLDLGQRGYRSIRAKGRGARAFAVSNFENRYLR